MNGEDKIFITVQNFLDSKKKNTRLSYAKALQLYTEYLGMSDSNDLGKYKIDKKGNFVLDKKGDKIFVGYVKTLTAQKYHDDLSGFVTALKNKGNDGNNPDEPLNKKTIMARTMGIRAYVTMNGMTIPGNYHLSMTTTIPDEDFEGKSYTPEQAKKIYQILSPKFKPIYILLYSSGVRIGEALQIEIKNVHFNENPVRIFLPKDTTKTHKARYVFITAEAAHVLKKWIEVLPKYLTQKKLMNNNATPKKSGLLFPMGADNLRTALTTANMKLGYDVNYYKVHSLRKSFRQNVGTVGKEVDLAESLLGHAKGDLNGVYANLQENIPNMGKKYLEIEKHLMLTQEGDRAVIVHDTEVDELKLQVALMAKQQAMLISEMQKLARGRLEVKTSQPDPTNISF